MKKKYTVLYTHQKKKKRKTWQDGILIVDDSGKTAVLKTEAKETLETVYIKQMVEVGDELESTKHLIQIEEIYNEEDLQPKPNNQMELEDDLTCSNPGTSRQNATCNNSRIRTMDLSRPLRKRTKFVIPRKVTSNQPPDENLKASAGVQSSVTNSVCDVRMEEAQTEKENIWTNVECCMEDSQHKTSNFCDQTARSTEEILEILRNAKRKKVETKEQHTPNCDVSEGNIPKEFIRLTSNSVPVTNRFVSPVKEFTLEDRLCQKFFFSTPEDHREMKGKTVQRAVRIPLTFSSVQSYVTALRKAIHEHLNIVLWNVSEKYHTCLAGADLANYAARFSWSYSSPIEDFPDMEERQKSKNAEPLCQHGIPGKLLTVNKEGKNKGRHFYVCPRPRSQSCKFFMWQESCGSFIPSAWSSVIHPIKLNNGRAVTSYLKRNGIDFYCECVFMRKSRDVYVHGTKVKVPEWIRKARGDDDDAYKGKIYIKLPRKESNSFYRKDDIWVISRTLFFKQDESFVARSTYHAPSSTDDLDIQPLDGYTPSHWNNGDTVFALHTFQALSELSCLRNLQDLALNSRTFPLLPHILNPNVGSDSHEENEENSVKPINQGELLPANYDDTVELAKQFVLKYGLNEDQSKALHVVVDMVCRRKRTMSPVMLIHGCFGSGKSFLLSVMIIFLSEIAIRCSGGSKDFKILLSTLTNVAVDRVLLSLLDLGFTSFCRVGSLGRIASRVLPLSVHMTADSEHIRELQTMLRNPDLSQQDKHYIKLSLRNVRSGIAKKNLNDSVLVGVTCASTNLDCLKSISFALVIIDECTQCTEPLSLLPISNFNCKSMILCGDPNQLPPTVQSFSSHKLGLEQTLFDRLAKGGHVPIKLLTQYRCHPQISRITGDLFYEGKLKNGITEDERPRILKNLPNLAFYDLSDGRAEKDTNSSSLRNPREASFVSDLVKLLVGHGVPGSNIGVVTMYKAQVDEILSAIQFMDLPDLSDVSCIQVSTVDAFQGAEKDVIILSCVLTSGSSEFLDSERMCVALTRARNHLLIVGHKGFLSSRPKWQRVIESCGDSVQTYFQFRKIWGKKLKKATMQANSSANRLLLSPYSASEFSPADTDEQKTFEPVSDKGIASNELLKDDEIDS